MFFSKPDELVMAPFLHYTNRHSKETMIFEWNDGTRLVTRLDTAYDSMNDLNEDEEGFEEYFACAMETVEIVSIGTAPVWDFEVGGLFEITYHNFPDFVKDPSGIVLLDKSKLLTHS